MAVDLFNYSTGQTHTFHLTQQFPQINEDLIKMTKNGG